MAVRVSLPFSAPLGSSQSKARGATHALTVRLSPDTRSALLGYST